MLNDATVDCSEETKNRLNRFEVIFAPKEDIMKEGKSLLNLAKKNIYQLYNLSDSISKVPISKTTDSVYCMMSKKLWDTILEVQKLNVPADTVRFVRYANKATGYQLNGFWNNRLKAIGSKEYREVFSILNTISPIKFEE